MVTTARGHIEQLPSGSFQANLPRRGLRRRAARQLLAQADDCHFPSREATLGQAPAKYLEVADLEG